MSLLIYHFNENPVTFYILDPDSVASACIICEFEMGLLIKLLYLYEVICSTYSRIQWDQAAFDWYKIPFW